MAYLTAFITLAVSLLRFQLTQATSTSPEECSDPLAQTCVHSSPFFKDYLQNVLRSFQYPQNIFILTDCINNYYFHRLSMFPVIPLAILVNLTELELTGIRLFDEVKPFIVLDLSETLVEHATKMIYETYQKIHTKRTTTAKWQPTISILWRSSPNGSEEQLITLQNAFATLNLKFNTRTFVYFVNDKDDEMYISYKVTVWEMYSIKLKRVFTIAYNFSKEEELIQNENFQFITLNENLESFAKRRHNFHLEPFSVSVKFDPHYTDWLQLSIQEDGAFSLTGGYVTYLYWDLKLLMNFSDHILLGDNPQVFGNGTVGGETARQLASEEVDLTLNQISFSLQRARALTFLQPTYYSLTYAFFKQPSTSSVRNIVTAAFQKELWMAMVGVWAILVTSTKVRQLLLHKFFTVSTIGSQEVDRKFVRESVLWSVAIFCQKTWHLDPSSLSLRMKFILGSLVGFMTYTAYSGSIVSSLAVNRIPVKNFFDLIHFNFLFTVHEYSEPFQTTLRGMIKSYSLKQDVKTVSTETEISHLFADSASLRKQVQSAKIAFLSPADMFYKTASFLNYTDSFMCEHVSSLSIGVYPSKSAMLVKKASQFKEVLNYMLIYLRQRGLVSRNIQNYNTQNFLKCIPVDEQDSRVDPATWIDVFTVILALLVGLVSALLLLLLEIAYVCYSDRKRTLSVVHSNGHYFVGFDTIDTYYMV